MPEITSQKDERAPAAANLALDGISIGDFRKEERAQIGGQGELPRTNLELRVTAKSKPESRQSPDGVLTLTRSCPRAFVRQVVASPA